MTLRSEYSIVPPVLHHSTVKYSFGKHDRGSAWLEHRHPDVIVVPGSPGTARRAVETLARYFQREFQYDFRFLAEDEVDYVAYLWTLELWDTDAFNQLAIGTCVFYPHGDSWTLAFVWIHPFFRSQGILSRSWDYFKSRFGRFRVECPLSPAMKRFLIKQKYEGPGFDWKFLETCE